MAKEKRIPSTATYLQGFGLNVTPPPTIRNRRVVIIGTAEDGPMYEPIQIEKPEDGEFVWGRSGAGDLVRGIFECWDVQTGFPTIVGVRIGNGKKALLEISELEGTGQDADQTAEYTALKIEAKNPGQIYNQVTIGYDENRNIAVYNPKTGIATTFSVDTEHPLNGNVDVHNVQELVEAINNDRNLSQVIEASYTPIVADYEIAISGSSSAVDTNTDKKVQINLQEAISYITSTGFMVANPQNGTVTSTNNLIEIEALEAVSISEWERLEARGKVINKLAISPLDGKSTSEWDTLQALKDYDSDNYFMNDPSGNVVSEYIYSINNAFCEGGAPDLGTELSGISGTNTFQLEVPICPDDSEEASSSGIALDYISGLIASTYSSFAGDATQATTQGITTKTVDGYALRPSGKIVIEVSTSSDPNGFWQALPYDTNSGVYMSSYSAASGYAEFSIGPTATGVATMLTLINSSGDIREGVYLRASCYTTKGFLGEVGNLNSLDTTSTTLDSYFVRGQEILFNVAPQHDMIVNYGTRIEYEIGANAEISDPNKGYISFTDPTALPGPGGGAISNTLITYIRFKYSFMPNFPSITSSAKALAGGTNGNALTGLQRRAELDTAYSKLRNYEANIWCPMGAFIDSITERYNPITGLKEEVPVGYDGQLEEFLDDLSINSLQPHAVLGVESIDGAVTQAAKDLWVERLTQTDITDPNRGANIMQQLENKFISVAAFEPIFLNIGRGRPYTANGQASYAGVLASIPYDISPTNKPISSINNVRFDLAISQYESMNDSRYVTMKTRVGRSPVIVEDKTAAPIGSDFVNWSIFSITAEASDRVRAVSQDYIGRPNSVEIRASLEQQISNALVTMSGLRAFDFSLNSNADQQVLGVIEIDLILVPIFTIKKIRTTVKLRKNLPAA